MSIIENRMRILIRKKWLISLFTFLIMSCGWIPFGLPTPPPFDSNNVEFMFWQNDNYLWTGNYYGVARLSKDGTVNKYPQINCGQALITIKPERIWCGEHWFDGESWLKTNIEIDTPIYTSDQNLWAGGPGGLAQFDPNRQEWIYVLQKSEDYTQSQQIFNRGRPGVHLVMEAQDGALWFYSYYDNAGINRWTEDSHQNWLLAGEDYMLAPRLETDDGAIWATNDPYNGRIAQWDGQEWRMWSPFSEMIVNPEIFEATDGTIWVASGFSEVGAWHNDEWQIWSPLSSDSNIMRVFQTEDGTIWIHSFQNEVGQWDGQGWRIFDKQEALSQSSTVNNNVKKCVPPPFEITELKSGDLNTQVMTEGKEVFEDNNNNVWFVLFEQEGINRWTGECWRQYTMTDGLSSNDISVLTFSPDNVLWAGTRDAGVNFYDTEIDQWQPFP